MDLKDSFSFQMVELEKITGTGKGARLTKKSLSLKLVELFLKTKFEGGRHLKRIKKI